MLGIKFSNTGRRTMIGSDAKKILEIKFSRMDKNASPRLKFNKLLLQIITKRIYHTRILRKQR